ncbi:hypothetical protein [Endozoicomonas ascidiicola]|uniref:hypothetical protein n=1 Tax=Endozoicomonas ascidiicola TaxID=1698521 RepID=UPI0008343772|nr:hypothetical protein [Endozoicomonas ascidiicola]
MSAIDMMGWPVVVVCFNYPATDQDAEKWLNDLSDILAKEAPFSMVIQARPNSEFSPFARKMLGLWFKENRLKLQDHCRGIARHVQSLEEGERVVSDNMQKAMPFPMKAFMDWQLARDWALERLESEGSFA